MTVEEVYKTLKDPKMSKLECNFNVKNEKGGSKPPKYFLEFQKQMLDFIKEQRQFNQFVLDQFKKHGWIK